MAKRKKSTNKSGVKSKLARSGGQNSQSSQPSAQFLNDSWTSGDSDIMETLGSDTGNTMVVCKVCDEEVVMNSEICYIKCCLCDCCFHGECLSIDENLLPHLHLFVEITGWCCLPCRNIFKRTIQGKQLLRSEKAGLTPSQANPNSTGLHDGEKILDFCNKLNTEINDIKLQIRTIADFLSHNSDVSAGIQHPLLANSVKTNESAGLGRVWSNVVKNGGTNNLKPNACPPNANSSNMRTVLKAVHGDLLDKQRRAKNINVSGLKPVENVPDSELFQQLYFSHLDINLDKPYCRRLGKVIEGKPGLLMVAFQDEHTAQRILSLAKKLRKSSDVNVKNNIYFNQDRTKAESSAEYEARQARRLRRANKPHHSSGEMDVVDPDHSSSVGVVGVSSQSKDSDGGEQTAPVCEPLDSSGTK